MLVTVESFLKPWEAHLFRLRLEAEGIPAFVTHEYHISMLWPYAVALGGAKVQVPDELRQEALEIGLMCRKGVFKTLLEESFGDLDDIHCPYCSSTKFGKRTSIPVAIAAALSLVVARTMFPAKATIYDCENCRRSWRRPLGIPVYEASLVSFPVGLTLFLLAILAFGAISSRTQTQYEPPTYPFSRYPAEYPRQ